MLGIDAQPLFGPRTGVYRYLKTLLDEILTRPLEPPIRLFGFQFMRDCALPTEAGWQGYDLRCIKRFPGQLYFKMLQAHVAFPVDFGCDTYFFPNFVGYPVRHGRTTVTVHDLAYLRYPQFVERKNLLYLRMALPPALRRADRIVAVSHATARDVEEFFGIGEKVVVVPNAVSPVFRPLPDDEVTRLLEPYGLSRQFLLCVGTIEPRKNFDGAVRAFANLPAELRRTTDLVIAGGSGWRDASFRETLARLKLDDHVRLVGAVQDGALTAMYNRALALIAPSHYEGFGLPLIEAMACGCAVLATDVSSHPEVTADAALLAPPDDDAALSAGMERMIRDGALRSTLIEKGKARVEQFRPGRVARQLLDVLAA